MRREFGGKSIELVLGDITRETTDAIVNAANAWLAGGGGVDGAIHRAGGPILLDECQAHIKRLGGPLPAGEAVLTSGGRLPARYVIHTAGPVWYGGDRGEAAHLARCYESTRRLADEHALATLAFPSISTGIYGYPVDRAAVIALRVLRDGLATSKHLREARFVLFDRGTWAAYRDALAALA